MNWQPISTAPTDRKQILVGFQGQHEWYSYVAPAFGDETGTGMPFAKPTHWTTIFPPNKGDDDEPWTT
ncbi:MAG TPA: hypothetical protein VEP90_00535 [Methylomirabilota bacterium]|nr:hypothetical protein [Methylomirabilota bacterium]